MREVPEDEFEIEDVELDAGRLDHGSHEEWLRVIDEQLEEHDLELVTYSSGDSTWIRIMPRKRKG